MITKSFFYVKNIVLCVILCNAFAGYGQQEPQYTQYMYNPLSLNPAYAGSRGAPSVIGLYRAQWVGLNGAPTTGQLSAHTPVGQKNHGIGLGIVHDEVGPSRETYVSGAFSYAIAFDRAAVFRFGVMAGAHSIEVNYNQLNPENPEDIEFAGKLSKLSPNVGVGAYLYTKDWFVSFSAPALLETKFYDDMQQSTASKRMHLYLSGGYTLPLNDNFELKPAAMITAVSGSPVKVDVSSNFVYDQRFYLGAAYRFNAAVSAMVGFQISEGLFIGYAYDRDIHSLGNYNSGSHEIFIRFDFLGKYCNCYL